MSSSTDEMGSADPRINDQLTSFDVAAVSLPGTKMGAIPIAASRAGGMGLLDLTGPSDEKQTQQILDRLQALAGERWGVLLNAPLSASAQKLLPRLSGASIVVLQPGCRQAPTPADISMCRHHGLQVGIVLTSISQLDSAESLAVDFIFAKGHEAGGWIGETTLFVLLQEIANRTTIPFYAWGGIGPGTATACRIAGAAGVVLDWQLALSKESELEPSIHNRIDRMDGSETKVVRDGFGNAYRLFDQPGFTAHQELLAIVRDAGAERFEEGVQALLGEKAVESKAWPIGQDACLARHGNRGRSVGRILRTFRDEVEANFHGALASEALQPGSALAESHGTRYPIVQGPMTRVSDVPEFCDAVERGGGLPFLALALMRKAQVETMLTRTSELLGDRPWGIGILGFVPKWLRDEQMEVTERIVPPFAVIAGGRPDQAKHLEEKGIATYLHVPSPAMLDMFVREGARRFVFEGLECGGHVGPRSSFVLWETMVRVLVDAELSDEDCARVHVLFAGGIHDDLSGAMAAGIAQPLLERGMKFGVLMGTGYLFTSEAVETGAIVPRFQEVALETDHTVLAETGPGHAIRCSPTDFYTDFCTEKDSLIAQALPGSEIRDRLENRNMGRLRIASKAIMRGPETEDGKVSYETVSEETQRADGMYMIGQVAGMHNETISIEQFHQTVSVGATDRVRSLRASVPADIETSEPPSDPIEIAVIGMSCMLPGGASNVDRYWENILAGHDAIGEIPEHRFDYNRWFDEDRKARDKIYSKWGGFLEDIPFDPLKYGIPPASLKSIEPMQLLALELVDQALKHSGYAENNPYRARTSVIIGAGGGAAELGGQYAFRSMLPGVAEEVDPKLLDEVLPEWTEDSFAGILLNVVAGRVSNRFDLRGCNFTVDAACASSLAAVYLGCRELAAHASDIVITGGCDTIQNPFGFLCFSKTGALSPEGKSKPFDESADGIAISEGHAAVVLKRLEDAERDGDTIYGVIRGVAGGSDGRNLGLTAPSIGGQLLTLERAYAQARFSPATVGIFEAHGTGTAVGDAAECTALHDLLSKHGAKPSSIAIGGVKSMIGHTKCAAGVAGLIKVILSLHHKILPPTLHVKTPNPKAGFGEGALYVNRDARPWIRKPYPRRAGVSAFGFGGSNFHATVEEYGREPNPLALEAPRRELPAEVFFTSAEEPADLVRALGKLRDHAETGISLSSLARTHFERTRATAGTYRVAIVSASSAQLLDQIDQAVRAVERGEDLSSKDGIYVAMGRADAGKIAFVFPGQGSQYTNMLVELAMQFPEVAECFETMDRVTRDSYDTPVSEQVFPPPMFTGEEIAAAEEVLKQTRNTQPALGASSVAMMKLLEMFGVRPDFAGGQSYGELVALHAGGGFTEEELYALSAARGRAFVEAFALKGSRDLGQMLAVSGDLESIAPYIKDRPNLWVANHNSPKQTVLTGSTEAIENIKDILDSHNVSNQIVPVECAFHSPLLAPARENFLKSLETVPVQKLSLPVFSNSTAACYPSAPPEIRELLADQLTNEVRWLHQVQAMHDAGARIFIEVGPHRLLSRFVDLSLADRPHLSVPLNEKGKNSIVSLMHALSTLYCRGGQHIDLSRLYQGRPGWTNEIEETPAKDSSRLYTLNGSEVRPANEPPSGTNPAFKIIDAKESGYVPDSPRPGPMPAEKTSPAATPEIAAPTTTRTDMKEEPLHMDAEGMVAFQQTMRKFLETQHAVMAAYLGGSPVENSLPAAPAVEGTTAPSPASTRTPSAPMPEVPQPPPTAEVEIVPPVAPPALSPAGMQDQLLRMVSDRTGYPADMLDPDANMEADLGIDSIKRVEIIAAFRREVFPEMGDPPAEFMERMTSTVSMNDILAVAMDFGPGLEEAAPVVPADPAVAAGIDYLEALTRLVSDRTGYPADMLDPDANLEADLGIDSIKRVEIIAAFRGQAMPGLEEPPAEYMEQMSEATTLTEIVAVADKFAPSANPVASPDSGSPVERDVPQREDLAPALIQIISDRTGYPPDMLARDANLEADLGIDSIKRVEIVAAFRKDVLPDMGDPSTEYMEQVSEAQTIDQILNAFEKITLTADSAGGGASIDIPDTTATAVAPTDRQDEYCPRCAIGSEESPIHSGLSVTAPDGVIIVVGDGGEATASVVEYIRNMGGSAELIPVDSLTDRERAKDLLGDRAAADLPIAGVIHLAGLSDTKTYPGIDFETWNRNTELEILSLLYLLQSLEADLGEDVPEPLRVLTVTRGGGDFLSAGDPESDCPWRAGITGLMKVAALEWPNAVFRAIDTDEPLECETLLREWHSPAGPVEVGYRRGSRLVLNIARQDLPEPDNDEHPSGLDGSDVILVTGGARGITAEIVCEMAAHVPANFVLVGRSPVPADKEDSEFVESKDPMDLRRKILERARGTGEKIAAKEVEKQIRSLLSAREIRATLRMIETHGGRAQYISCDVRDPDPFGETLKSIEQSSGSITAVVHGAGIIEDKRISDKTRESFNRVMSTKLQPLLTLSGVLDLKRLKLAVLFSSTAGFFGNAGQCDYAAANEILNRIAANWRTLGVARVCSLNWGPWSGAGMVTPEVARQFNDRGVGMVSVAGGRAAAWREICAKGNGDVRALLGPGAWVQGGTDVLPGRVETHSPLLANQEIRRLDDGQLIANAVLDPEDNGYLHHHRIDDKPVLPFAAALEFMAELAAAAEPNLEVVELRNVKQLKGIVLENGSETIQIVATPVLRTGQEAEWHLSITLPDMPRRKLYESTVRLCRDAPTRPAPPNLESIHNGFPLSLEEAYHQWLFHGRTYQRIRELHGSAPDGIDATVEPSPASEAVRTSNGTGWLIDPIALDVAPQIAALWARGHFGTTPLPFSVAAYHRYGPLGKEPLSCVFRTRDGSNGSSLVADVWFVRDNKVLGHMSGLECAGSTELNRITGKELALR